MAIACAVTLTAGAAFAGDTPVVPEAERKPLPRFEVELLDGKRFRSTELKGKVSIVSFWASWCAPCKQELTFLDRFRTAHAKDDLSVIAIATDGPETVAKVRSTVRRKRWKLPTATDAGGSATQVLNPRGSVPFTLFIDRQGRIAYTHAGYTGGDEAIYERVLAALLEAE